jgi:hypothetical protein
MRTFSKLSVLLSVFLFAAAAMPSAGGLPGTSTKAPAPPTQSAASSPNIQEQEQKAQKVEPPALTRLLKAASSSVRCSSNEPSGQSSTRILANFISIAMPRLPHLQNHHA